MTKSMVITGASGFIGKQLVRRLKTAGIDLLLVGRDVAKLETMFPGIASCTYGQIAENAATFDALVHLAVLNNDQSGNSDVFDTVNVGLLSGVVEEAKAARIKTLVNVTTFHALDVGKSPYAQSKMRALEVLKGVEGIRVVNLFLPAVYGDDYAGKLSVLKRLPPLLRRPILTILGAMVPALHIERLMEFLAGELEHAEARVLLANPQDENSVYRFGKRAIDLGFAFTVIGLFWWLLAIIWLAVRLTSKGPGIFAQVRVGQHGEPFTCYKFRTMRVGTKQTGTHEVSASAVTNVGKLLRKSKLDELPQFVNALRGELSLVGPRPCLPIQTQLITERQRCGVYAVLPGITGTAQVSNIDMSNPERLAEVDAEYAARRSLSYDLLMIVRTVLGGGYGDRVR